MQSVSASWRCSQFSAFCWAVRIRGLPILETTSDCGCATAFASPNVSTSLTHKAPATPGPCRFPARARSPGPGGSAFHSRERSRREVGLEAADPVWPDNGVVGCPGRQVEPVADEQLNDFGPIRQPERDRTRRDDDHLVVAMVVGGIPIMRAIRPAAGLKARGPEARAGIHFLSPPRRRRPIRRGT